MLDPREVTDVEASHLSFGEELQLHIDRRRGTDDPINVAAHLRSSRHKTDLQHIRKTVPVRLKQHVIMRV